MTRNPRKQRGELSRVLPAIRENGPAAAVAVIAFTGSFSHIVAVLHNYGMPGFEAYPVAGVVDLICVMGATERQRDKRIGRRRKGWVSWPTIILCLGVILTLAINEKNATPNAWGWIGAAIAPVAMLLAVSLLERRASWQGSGNQNQNRREPSPAATGTTVRKTGEGSRNQVAAAAGTSTPAVPGTTPEPAAEPAAAQNREPRPDTAGGDRDGRKLTMEELADLARLEIAEYAAASDGKRISWAVLGLRLGVAKKTAGDVLRLIDEQDAGEALAAGSGGGQ